MLSERTEYTLACVMYEYAFIHRRTDRMYYLQPYFVDCICKLRMYDNLAVDECASIVVIIAMNSLIRMTASLH